MLPEVLADFDRLRSLIRVSKGLYDGQSGEALSMINEYLCVAITGRLEQNIKQILIRYAEDSSHQKMSAPISRLCQQFQNPDKNKIVELVALFDKDFSHALSLEWSEDASDGNVISDMVGKRKAIAHQTRNNRDTTGTKIDLYFKAYQSTITRLHGHFLGR